MIESGIINCTSTRPHAAGDFLSVREKQETKQPVGRKGKKKTGERNGQKRGEGRLLSSLSLKIMRVSVTSHTRRPCSAWEQTCPWPLPALTTRSGLRGGGDFMWSRFPLDFTQERVFTKIGIWRSFRAWESLDAQKITFPSRFWILEQDLWRSSARPPFLAMLVLRINPWNKVELTDHVL